METLAVARFPSDLSIQPKGMTGVVMFRDVPEGCRVTIFLQNLEPHAVHAIHVHEKAFKSKEDQQKGCSALGGHFNPTDSVHGSIYVPNAERHAGDLINNVFADANGTVHVSYIDDMLKVNSQKFTPVGRSIVLHSFTDDLGLGGLLSTVQGNPRPPRLCSDMEHLAFAPYQHMSHDELRQLQLQRYPEKVDFQKEELISLFTTQSLVTGNAGGRIACANIHTEVHGAFNKS